MSSDGSRQKLAKAAVTLNDCLACSGCVTSAESVLVELQNHAEFVKELSAIAPGGNRGAGDGRLAVVSLSPQSTASVAARYGVTMDQAARRLTGFLKRLGVAKVFDTSFGRAVSLVEAQREFLNRYKAADEGAAGTRSFPVLVSACPGWICFAEKTHGDFVLPHISTVKSAQQVPSVSFHRHPAACLAAHVARFGVRFFARGATRHPLRLLAVDGTGDGFSGKVSGRGQGWGRAGQGNPGTPCHRLNITADLG